MEKDDFLKWKEKPENKKKVDFLNTFFEDFLEEKGKKKDKDKKDKDDFFSFLD